MIKGLIIQSPVSQHFSQNYYSVSDLMVLALKGNHTIPSDDGPENKYSYLYLKLKSMD